MALAADLLRSTSRRVRCLSACDFPKTAERGGLTLSRREPASHPSTQYTKSVPLLLLFLDLPNAIYGTQHVQAFHSYADSRGNLVPAHHYCACPKHTGEKALMRQCVIYDSDKADARLIGVEYIVAEEVRWAEGSSFLPFGG